jgi:hypothetical protein
VLAVRREYAAEARQVDLRVGHQGGKPAEVTVFLMADAVACPKTGQKVPQGY